MAPSPVQERRHDTTIWRLRHRLHPLGYALLLVTLLAWSCLATGADARQDTGEAFRVGVASGVFPDVDRQDAQVAMQLWTTQLTNAMDIATKPETVVFTQTDDLVKAVNKGELSIAVLSALEYLRLRGKAAMNPAFVSINSMGAKRKFVLIARRDSGIRTVRDLKGKTLALPSLQQYSAGHIWLDVLLLREGLPDATRFCRQAREVIKNSQSITGVFFGQNDAAVVSRGAMETSFALNPQLGRQLIVLAESPPLLGDLSCIPHSVNIQLRRAIEHAAVRIHETATGRQMFTLFQMDRAILFQASHLAPLEELLRERDRLRAGRKVRR